MSTTIDNLFILNSTYTPHQSHDAYGKDSLGHAEIITDCCKARLNPRLLERINFNGLRYISTDHIFSGQLLKYQSDIICKVPVDHKAGVIYLMIELQSTADRYMAQRLNEYMALLVLSHKRAYKTHMRPFILPICMYNGERPYPYSTQLCDCVEYPELAREYGMLDGFELWDLTQSTIDELLTHRKAGLFQALYKQAKSGNFVCVLEKVTPEYVQQLPPSHIQSSAMYIYHHSRPEQGEECLRLLSKLIENKTIKEEVMSYADSLRNQGLEAGIQEGLTRGKELGIQEGVTRGKQLGILEGKQAGKQEGILQTAKNLLRQGVEMGTILLATGLQRDQLLQLKEQRC